MANPSHAKHSDGMSKERTKRLVLLQAKLISRTRFALWLCNHSIGILNALKPHECDEHPCTAAAAFALLPVQACLVCRQCPHVSSLFLYFAFCERCGELLDSGGAHPAGFPNRKGNAFSSGRSSGATPKSSVCIPAKHTSSCTRVSGAGESTRLPFQLPGPGQTLP